MIEDLRGVFFIVKGQYRKGAEPSFVNNVTKDTMWIGGYDPNSEDTETWYMCLDRYTFQCRACGSDLKKVLKAVHTCIVKYKDLKHYLHHISKTTSDDTYEVKYLGKRPLTSEERVKKAEGRCPRVSPPMRCLYEAIYEEYGDHFSALVEEQEDLAYEELKGKTPFKKAKKMVKTKPLVLPKKEETPKKILLKKAEKPKTPQKTTKVIKPIGKKTLKKLTI